MPNFCGGIKLGETLKVEDGIITLVTETPNEETVVTPCGMLWDSNVFEVTKVSGRPVLTSVGIEEEMGMPVIVKSNCGLALDGLYFTVNADKSIDFNEAHVLEVLFTPIDATVAVTYGDDSTPVEPIPGTTNMYKLDEIDATYSITVSKEGYTSQTEQVTADENHIVEINLEVAQG